ncbi:MAG: hypothetical protein UY39_C0010G0003 [Candidatus Kaiserbacteria bacterium GW2011_GWC2_49_12]|uniref:Uncharacterized protein n=4 Tax=Candidatus Kaiseribacteriota TaxID=1752734 RepID=A0A0G1YQM5_9BACT|nr:MAG: hypothetical protein UY39_C0010G0003 [Candidatus Kaiserbacteria bacterium GW2011_GWC2_49_12]KKW09274.1 MAG: hypothetical protein UY46_C0004G0001 [Candidatus Kaiserbacteria bacterium GW2011_GWA2_49_56]KKW17307.1 MAG: hypothetical protein UY57_C0019G0002 [Candidatus Kaiserbacteria bacterium GW2011_GWB1_50_17]KKW18173.1 MAG: hypothetical protein UY59_C0013G0002 [Candidatus Kaiserbacteria bacterium GW2011_GWA1_50_28]
MKKDAKNRDVPSRVAPRLEGKVKNVGIKPKKKPKGKRDGVREYKEKKD